MWFSSTVGRRLMFQWRHRDMLWRHDVNLLLLDENHIDTTQVLWLARKWLWACSFKKGGQCSLWYYPQPEMRNTGTLSSVASKKLIHTWRIVRLITPENASKTTFFSAPLQSLRYSGFIFYIFHPPPYNSRVLERWQGGQKKVQKSPPINQTTSGKLALNVTKGGRTVPSAPAHTNIEASSTPPNGTSLTVNTRSGRLVTLYFLYR